MCSLPPNSAYVPVDGARGVNGGIGASNFRYIVIQVDRGGPFTRHSLLDPPPPCPAQLFSPFLPPQSLTRLLPLSSLSVAFLVVIGAIFVLLFVFQHSRKWEVGRQADQKKQIANPPRSKLEEDVRLTVQCTT